MWAVGIGLAILAASLRPHASVTAALATCGPFATLAAIIVAAALAGKLGAFRALARAAVPAHASRAASAVAVLALTAGLSALVNLDVAVVVAVPVALRVARRQELPAGRLAVAVAVTANAASFLLPTSNITNLLLLDNTGTGRTPGHAHLTPAAYLGDSWAAWLLVAVLTIAPLALWSARAENSAPAGSNRQPTGSARAGPPAPSRQGDGDSGPSIGALSDLLPMFLIASAVRALLGTGLVLHGTFLIQLASGTALATSVSNLPAAAAFTPTGLVSLWAAILATTIGPNLLITGSVASLISRRIARDGGARFSVRTFTAAGMSLVPLQLAAAALGLYACGVLS